MLDETRSEVGKGKFSSAALSNRGREERRGEDTSSFPKLKDLALASRKIGGD